jgi:hypothetical protein
MPTLCTRFKAMRNSTKWRSVPLTLNADLFTEMAVFIGEEIELRVSTLTRTVARDLIRNPNKIIVPDIIALVYYAHAKYGMHHSLAALQYFEKDNNVKKCIIKNGEIMFSAFSKETHYLRIPKNLHHLFEQLLPNYKNSTVEIERF